MLDSFFQWLGFGAYAKMTLPLQHCFTLFYDALLLYCAVYTQALCSVLDVFAIPMLQCLADGTSSYEDRIARLKSERTQLKKRLAELVSADSADSDTCEV